jgi:phage antirepressor YoqD-like protein
MNLLATTNQPLTMSSREIAKLTEKEHKTVMRDIRVMLNDLGHGTDLYLGQYPSNNRMYDEYNLPKRETLLLVSGYLLHVRVKIVDRLEELEKNQSKMPTLPNFSDPAQAARAWAEQYEANMIKQQQLELAAPKVEFHDKIVNDAATFSLRDAAKKIQQRPNKFSEWLRMEGYLCQNNLPKQQYINQGLFKTHTGTSKDEYQFSQTRVTSKGLSYFTNKLGNKKL